MERHLSRIFRGLALIGMLLAGSAAQAVSFTGTLDLDDLVYDIPQDIGGIVIDVPGALDIQRFSLGNSNDGPYEVAFTPGDFNTNATLLGFAITNHPNDTLLADPSLLIGIVDGSADFGDIFEGTQWTVIWGVAPLVTTYLSEVLDGGGDPLGPFNMTAGTDYYVFAAGGSVAPLLVDYTLEVSAVPEPETWILLLLGAALLLLLNTWSSHRKDIDSHQ